MNRIMIFIVVCTTILVQACSTPSRNCEAGSPILFPAFPYNPGQELIFRDSAGHELKVKLAATFGNSNAYTIKGQSAFSNSAGEDCVRTTSLSSSDITAADSILPEGNQFFVVSYSKNESVNSGTSTYFLMNAFGNAVFNMMVGADKSLTANQRDFESIFNYTTPYKTYSKAYKGIIRFGQPENRSIFYFSTKGQLLSLTLRPDTTRVFYFVE